MAEPVDNHEADVFVSQLWRHIYQRMAALMHPHARAHQPGGIDPVELPLGFLKDVTITSPAVGDFVKCINADNAGGTWANVSGADVFGEFIAGMYLGELLGAHVGFFTRLADDGVHQRFVFEATDSTDTPRFSVEVDENGSVYLNGVAQ